MRTRLKQTIDKLFYKMGYSAPKRLPTAKMVYKRLNRQSLPVIQYRLKHIVSELEKHDDHPYYNQLLKEFVPSWNPPSKPEFIGKGFGVNNLNSYRKINNTFFEKIYFNPSVDLINHQWFLNHIADSPLFPFRSPQIKEIYKGEFLSIAYFEFLDLKKLSIEKYESQAVSISKALYKISTQAVISQEARKGLQPIIISHDKTNRRIQTAQRRLEKNRINVSGLEELLNNSKHIYTHDDLSENNVFDDNIVIDWDYFGLYPIGTDIAKIFIQLKRNSAKTGTLSSWLEKNYRPFIMDEDWESLKRNVFYLLYVYHYVKYAEWEFMEELEEEILEELINY